MDNPIHTLRSFISDKAGRMRTAAKETIDGLLEPDKQNPQSTSGDSAPPPTDSHQALHSATRDADRDASVAFGGHHRHSEQSASEADPDHGSPAEEQTSPSKPVSTSDDELTDSAPQGEDPGDAIGVLFNGESNSVRRLRPVSDHPTDNDRHRQTRHLFVTTGESTGQQSGDNSRADVTLDVSKLDVGKLELDVEDLKAQVALQASIAELVDVNVGADVELGEVELDIQGVTAEALLEVHLDEIRQLLGRALKTLEQRPELITQALNTAEHAAGEIDDTAEAATCNVDDAAESLTDDIGDTTGETARQVSEPSIQAESRAEFSDDDSRNQ